MSRSRLRLILGVATLAYFAAVVNRSSMGVASLDAAERFQVSAADLSLLTVVQLATYALFQIPVGLVLDRVGSKFTISLGVAAIGLGQLLVGYTDMLFLALVGRIAVGFGDAFVFISMLRLVNGWIHGPKATKIQQLLTNLGQLGQIFSAIPFVGLLHNIGWNAAFWVIGFFSLAVSLVVITLIQDPVNHERPETIRHAFAGLRQSVRQPVVRMAFWVHYSLQSAASVFILLWGYPYLVVGQRVDPALASLLLGSFVIAGFLTGPIVAQLCTRFPLRRSNLVFAFGGFAIFAWVLVLSFPAPAPIWVVILLVIALAMAGPASMIAFDLTRSSVDFSKLGSANGFVNIGGFLATFCMMYASGLVVDLYTGGSRFGLGINPEAFRLAMLVPLVNLLFGLSMVALERRKSRAVLAAQGIRVSPLLSAAKNKLWK